MEDRGKGHRSDSFIGSIASPGKTAPDRPIPRPPAQKPVQKNLKEALRESEARVALDLEALKRLHAVAMRLIEVRDLAPLLEETLDAAIEIAAADYGNIYLLEAGTEGLRMAAHRGFPPEYLEYFRKGRNKAHAVVRAVNGGRCVLVEDIADHPLFAFTDSQKVLLEAGVRSLASTPLASRDGRIQGALTVHWREPHRPEERVLRFLDLLSAQAADAIERVGAEEALATSEERYRALFHAIDEGFCIVEVLSDARGEAVDGRFLETNPAFERLTGMANGKGGRLLERIPDHGRTWLDVLEKVAATGEPAGFESEAGSPHGWYRIHAFRHGKPRERQVALLLTEISDRKRVETALQETEKRFWTSVEVLPLGFAILKPVRDAAGRIGDMRFEYVNEAAGRLGGYRREERIGRTLLEIYPSSAGSRLVRDCIHTIESGELLIEDAFWLPLPGAGGEDSLERAYDIRAVRLEDGVVAAWTDVTERKRIEETIREDARLYRRLFDQSPMGAAIISPDFRFIRVNRVFSDILGYSADELASMSFRDVTLPEDRESDLLQSQRILSGEVDHFEREKRYIRKDGRLVWALLNLRGVRDEEGRLLYFMPLLQDITDRKAMEEELASARRHLDTLIHNSPLAMIEFDALLNVVRWNREAERTFGWSAGEIVGTSYAELPWRIEEDRRPSRRFAEELLGGACPYSVHVRWARRKDGSFLLCQWHVSTIFDNRGKAACFIMQAVDITEQRSAEEALRASEDTARRQLQEIEAIYSSAGVGLCLLDKELRFVRVNDRMAEMNGVPVVEHIGRTVREVVPGLSEIAEDLMRQVLETGKPVLDYEVIGETAARPGVERTWIEQWIPMKSAEGDIVGINIVAEDVTERVAAQEALLALVAEKDILLRELSHRTKNNMQVVVGLLGLQAGKSKDGDTVEALGKAQDRIRAMALVHEKLYRSGTVSTLSMKEYLKDLVTTVLRSHQGSKGPVQPVLELEETFLSIDEALPCGLIVNELLSNSLKHAFRGMKHGTISLSLRCGGGEAVLRYGDDGPGLSKALDLPRCGSLGLKLVYNLAVLQLRGRIEIGSGPGMQVTIAFPLPHSPNP